MILFLSLVLFALWLSFAVYSFFEAKSLKAEIKEVEEFNTTFSHRAMIYENAPRLS